MTLDQIGLMAIKCGGKVYQSYYGNIGIIKVLIVVVCGESHQILDQYSKLLNFILIVSPKTQQKKLTNKN